MLAHWKFPHDPRSPTLFPHSVPKGCHETSPRTPRRPQFPLPSGGDVSGSEFWLTPPEMYESLDEEFRFDFDPCPYPRLDGFNGVAVPWGRSNYVNPPFRRSDGVFGAGPTAFVRKAIDEKEKGNSSVIVLNTMSFINLLLEAGAECRSMGRVRWLDTRTGKPWGHPANTTAFILKAKP